jgi:hypothetical protein
MFPHRSVHKCTSSEENTQNQIDNVFIDRRRHSSVTDVRYFRGYDCDTDHCMVVAKVRGRLAVSKRAAQKIDTERLNRKKWHERNVKEQYQITIRKNLQLWKT